MNHKRIFIVMLAALLPLLAACQTPADSRAQFCRGLRGLAPAVTQLAEGKDAANAGALKQQLTLFRDQLSLVVSQAAQSPSLSLDNLIQSLEAFETQVRALPDAMPIQQAMASVKEAAGRFEREYQAIASAVCAAE
jgi:hypothetical protein